MRQNPISISLIIGDLIMLIFFVLTGKKEHGLSIQSFETIVTIISMALAWLIAARITGAFRGDRASSWASMVKSVLLSTVIATPLGLIVRSIILHKSIGFIFFFVAFAFIFLYVMVWRIIYLLYLTR